uniref:Uncharacterized protein n=1 Tax=Solanum tuberosum TaxID=4113 RepID=M1DB03_SOLTU
MLGSGSQHPDHIHIPQLQWVSLGSLVILGPVFTSRGELRGMRHITHSTVSIGSYQLDQTWVFRERTQEEKVGEKVKIRQVLAILVADFAKDSIIRVKLRSENELKNSSGTPGEKLARRAPDAPEGLGQRARSAPKYTL